MLCIEYVEVAEHEEERGRAVVWWWGGGSFFKPSAIPPYSLRVCPLLPAAERGLLQKRTFTGCRLVVWHLRFVATW